MHNLPNKKIVRRYRIAALFVLMKWLLFTIGVPLSCYGLAMGKRDLVHYAIGCFALAGLLSLGHWAVGARARCPLCFVPSFSHQQQSKSRKALSFLGSYRFFVALGVLFMGWFHCPYCGEDTAMQARQKNSR